DFVVCTGRHFALCVVPHEFVFGAQPIFTQPLCSGMSDPSFETGCAESCAIARKQCFLADFRPSERRVWMRDDFARIKLHNPSASVCLLPLTGHEHLLSISCPGRMN